MFLNIIIADKRDGYLIADQLLIRIFPLKQNPCIIQLQPIKIQSLILEFLIDNILDKISQQVFANAIILIDCQHMNQEIPIGNRVIFQKMHLKERKRHLSKLQEIKTKSTSSIQNNNYKFFKSSTFIESDKYLEIEKNNIVLFNRIASIIKQKPKIEFPNSRSFVKSVDQALEEKEKKKQNFIKSQNLLFEKRINQQRPTIKNNLIFKDRLRTEKYLKLIGKFPFNPHRRTQTEEESFGQSEQMLIKEEGTNIFSKRTLDFSVKIIRNLQNNSYVFCVMDLQSKVQHRLEIENESFREQLIACQLSYQSMISRLRLGKDGQMKFDYLPVRVNKQK